MGCSGGGSGPVYGRIMTGLQARADAGRIALGGCVIYEDMPTWKFSAAHKWADGSRLRMDGVAFVRRGGHQTDNTDGHDRDDSSGQ